MGRRAAGSGSGPSVLDHVTPAMSCYTDEIFGPVLSVLRVSSYAEAVELVNSSRYGNGAAIFTCDGGAARRFVSEAEAGMVGVNVPIPVPMAYYSFGGWKASLFGDTHVHGAEGVHFYTRGKVVTSRWPDPSHGGVQPRLPGQYLRNVWPNGPGCVPPARREPGGVSLTSSRGARLMADRLAMA